MASSPVLLLHGQPGGAREWAPVQSLLSGTTTIAIDRPGWDGSSRPTDLTGNAIADVILLVAAAWFFLKERATLPTWLGVGLIATGVWLVSTS